MSPAEPIRIVAQVDGCEQNGVRIGGEFLARSIAAARPATRHDFALTFADPDAPPHALPPAHIHVLSLLPELSRSREAKDSMRSRWSERIGALQERANLVFLCTIFRNVRGRDRSGRCDETLVRIRELDLLAIELSHALGVRIIDLDRVLAHFGARPLNTDYRLGGAMAAGLVGHTMASAVLAAGLDDMIDPVVQEAARTTLGGPENVPALLKALAGSRGPQGPADG
jgi:hypothetical protein